MTFSVLFALLKQAENERTAALSVNYTSELHSRATLEHAENEWKNELDTLLLYTLCHTRLQAV